MLFCLFPWRALRAPLAAQGDNLQGPPSPWLVVGRFGEYDGSARLVVVGAAMALVGYLLPWVTFRLNLQAADLSGLDLVVAPAQLARIGTPTGLVEGAAVAALAGLGLIAVLAGFLLAVVPGLRLAMPLPRKAGQGLAVVGLAAAVLVMLLLLVWVGPQVGVTQVSYGAALVVVGLGLAVVAWPRARLLGDEDAQAEPPPPPSQGAADGPR